MPKNKSSSAPAKFTKNAAPEIDKETECRFTNTPAENAIIPLKPWCSGMKRSNVRNARPERWNAFSVCRPGPERPPQTCPWPVIPADHPAAPPGVRKKVENFGWHALSLRRAWHYVTHALRRLRACHPISFIVLEALNVNPKT